MSENISGKVVVITGASSGLGAETARHLTSQGAKVVLGARRLDRLEALANELGLDAKAVMQTDVTDRSQVKTLVDRAVELYGRIDVMLNNAGLMPSSMLDKLKIDEWDRMIDVNIKGVLYGVAAALPHMQSQKAGQIINVSSVAGHKVGPGGAVYAGTKWAVRAISEGLRQEVKPLEHPHDHHFAGGSCDRTDRHDHRSGRRCRHGQDIREGHPAQFVRARSGQRVPQAIARQQTIADTFQLRSSRSNDSFEYQASGQNSPLIVNRCAINEIISRTATHDPTETFATTAM